MRRDTGPLGGDSLEPVRLHDPSRRDWRDAERPRPLSAHVLVPEAAGPYPVVLLTHGTGGAFSGLVWLATALADAGFLVAGVDHHGNTWVEEEYLPEGFAFVWERPRDLSFLLDRVAESFDVDLARVGAAGFSLGGYTVAAALGARLDTAAIEFVLTEAPPDPIVPEFPDLLSALRARHDVEALRARAVDGGGSFRDPRVRAGFLIAPAIGALVDRSSLAEVAAPVAVRWGDADDNSPPEQNALVYLSGLGAASGESVGKDAGHYVFLEGEPDPTGVRERVARDAVAFFRRELA